MRIADCGMLTGTRTTPLGGTRTGITPRALKDFAQAEQSSVPNSAIGYPHSICFGSLSQFADGPMASQQKLFLAELRATLVLALPMMIGQFGQMLMGITDTLVLGRVGIVPLAAVGFSNTLLGTLYVGGIGILAAVGIFAAQAHGAKLENAKIEVFLSAFWLSLFVGIATAAIVIALLPVLSI